MYALVSACFGRIARGRLGHRLKEFPRVHAVLAFGGDACPHGPELFPAGLGPETPSHRHRLRGLDGHRAVGTALLGIVLFGESASPARLLCIGLILAGIAGLKLLPMHNGDIVNEQG